MNGKEIPERTRGKVNLFTKPGGRYTGNILMGTKNPSRNEGKINEVYEAKMTQ